MDVCLNVPHHISSACLQVIPVKFHFLQSHIFSSKLRTKVFPFSWISNISFPINIVVRSLLSSIYSLSCCWILGERRTWFLPACLTMCFSCNSLLCPKLTINILLIISSIVIKDLSLTWMVYLLKDSHMFLHKGSHFDCVEVWSCPHLQTHLSQVVISRFTLSLTNQGQLDTLLSCKQLQPFIRDFSSLDISIFLWSCQIYVSHNIWHLM